MKNKAKLHKNLGDLTTEKKQEVVQLEIALRTLKLETLDLHVKNLQIQEVALTAQRESEAKDRVITNLQRELEQLKKTMQPKFAQVSLQDLEDELQPLELETLMPQTTFDSHRTVGSFTSPRVSLTLPPSTDRSTMSSMAENCRRRIEAFRPRKAQSAFFFRTPQQHISRLHHSTNPCKEAC